jgi:hypothetical protein
MSSFHGGVGAAIIIGGIIIGGTITGVTIQGATIIGSILETDVAPSPRILISGTEIDFFTGDAAEVTSGLETMSVVSIGGSPAGEVFLSAPDFGHGTASLTLQSRTADGISSGSYVFLSADNMNFPNGLTGSATAITINNNLTVTGGNTLHVTGPVVMDTDVTNNGALWTGAWATYTPTFTNITGGAGAFRWKRIGRIIYLHGAFSAGTATAAAAIQVSLPAGITAVNAAFAGCQNNNATIGGNVLTTNVRIFKDLAASSWGAGDSIALVHFDAVFEATT